MGTSRLKDPRRVFAISAGTYLGLVLCYIVSVIAIVPYPESIRALMNQPNYSIFALIVFPWAVGLFAISVNPALFGKKYRIGHIFLALALLLVLSIINVDAQEKGPPHLPFHFAHPTTDALRESIACAETRRRGVLADTIKPEVALSEYKKCVAENLGIDESDVQRFDGTADFLARGSLVAYVDYVYTAAAAMFGTVYFWYLFFLRFTRQPLSPKVKDRLLLVYLFLLIWIPTRIYSIWHQSFFSIPEVGHSIPIVTFAGAASLVLLLLIFKPGPVMVIISVAEAILSSVAGIIGVTKPEYFLVLGELFDDMHIYSFLVIELMVLLTLMAVVSQHFDFFDDQAGNHANGTLKDSGAPGISRVIGPSARSSTGIPDTRQPRFRGRFRPSRLPPYSGGANPPEVRGPGAIPRK